MNKPTTSSAGTKHMLHLCETRIEVVKKLLVDAETATVMSKKFVVGRSQERDRNGNRIKIFETAFVAETDTHTFPDGAVFTGYKYIELSHFGHGMTGAEILDFKQLKAERIGALQRELKALNEDREFFIQKISEWKA